MISILCPCYNEEAVLDLFFERISKVTAKIPEKFEFICVNDGSKDKTLEILKAHAQKDSRIKVIDFSRNFGKEAALTAALDYCRGNAAIPIDVDLQQPPELISKMIEKWREGYEVVAARRDRATDSWLKKITALAFYKFQNSVSRYEIPANVGDFRLLDRKVIDALKQMKESLRFMKGLFAWAGFKTCMIDYKVEKRIAGESKFTFWNLVHFAIDGLTSFSTAPLTLWLYLGGGVSLCAFLYGIFIFARTILFGIEVPGYASLLCLTLFFGGFQMLGIGILGEYVGRTYIESKQRPVYIVREFYEAGS